MATLLRSVMGAFAEFERALIRERQREGIALAKRREAYRGRKKEHYPTFVGTGIMGNDDLHHCCGALPHAHEPTYSVDDPVRASRRSRGDTPQLPVCCGDSGGKLRGCFVVVLPHRGCMLGVSTSNHEQSQEGFVMFARQERRPMRAHTPAIADDTTFAPPSRGPTPASSPGAVALPPPPVGFDLGRIAIHQPAPQVGAAGGVLNPATASRIEARQGAGRRWRRRCSGGWRGRWGTPSPTCASMRTASRRRSAAASARAFTLGSDVFLGREATSGGGTAGIACWRTS